ncbi:MAG TPA: hypothetical protein VF108_04335 [Actinomycetota bacterium]
MIRLGVALLVALASVGCSGTEMPAGRRARRVSPQEFRVLAMELLQTAAAAELDVYQSEGRFSERPEELAGAGSVRFVVTSGIGAPGRVSLETCDDDRVVVLGTEAGDGSVFVVKLRGVPPASSGNAVFSHYAEDPLCDATDGAEAWPNGYRVSGQGLVQEAVA